MLQAEGTEREYIEGVLRNARSFALFRAPGSGTIRLLSSDVLDSVDSVSMLNGKSGFVFAPFRTTVNCPILLMEDPVERKFDEQLLCADAAPLFSSDSMPTVADSSYLSHFECYSSALRSGEFTKLVLSRKRNQDKTADFSLYSLFIRACAYYPYSYIYIFSSSQTGCWMGCTPETLLSGNRSVFRTVALAGTQPIIQVKLPDIWDKKNIEEQRIVADYMRTQLSSQGISCSERGPFTVKAGALAHLKSELEFTLRDISRLGSLLDILHPSPAVCGFPKKKAYRFIRENEGYDRRYYSGFLGLLQPKDETDIYVNLRCMEVTNTKLVLYAGGGLLLSSVMQNEWNETEEKMKTMERLILNSINS